MSDIFTVPERWPGSTIVCLACGPSATQEAAELVRGKFPVVAINTAGILLAPWANVLYAADKKWWGWHDGAEDFDGLKITIEHGGQEFKHHAVRVVKNTGPRGLETERDGVRVGSNSGYQAINIARHLGAKKIILIGYDMGPDDGGANHFFGESPDKSVPPYGLFLSTFPSIVEPLQAEGIEVVNTCERSKLKCFPKMPLIEAVQWAKG